MKQVIGGAALALVGALWVKVYGDYRYYQGKCDVNACNKIVIDVQKDFINDLLKRLKEKEKEQKS